MAGDAVNSGMSTIKCSYGSAPMPYVVENPSYMVGEAPGGTISDAIPFANIPTFGQCMCMDNPENAAFEETGVYAPCVPMTEEWIPDVPNITFQGLPILDKGSTCMCDWGGEITVETVPPNMDVSE
jgi:hypothetical protein